MPSFDISMLIVAATLVMFGLLMVYSASIALADGPRYESYGRFYFVMRHGLFILVGLFCALCAVGIPMQVWQKFAVPLFLFSLLLLLIVLIPGIGRDRKNVG